MSACPPARPEPTATARGATAKRAKTRALIIATAVDTIAELGLRRASAATIAQRSGLSWGVIQYHFGDLLGLLLATFENAIDTYEDNMRAGLSAEGPVEDRTRELLARQWAQMTDAPYQSLLEIQLELHREPRVDAAYRAGAVRAGRASRLAWRTVFVDVDSAIVDRTHDLAISSLRGLAVSHALGTPARASAGTRKELLALTVRALRTSSSAAARPAATALPR